MLARGPMGKPAPAKKEAPVEEEKKAPIKLNVFDEGAEDEMDNVKRMAAREDEPLSASSDSVGRMPAPKIARKPAKKMTTFDSSDD
jgi:hypothetical protein